MLHHPHAVTFGAFATAALALAVAACLVLRNVRRNEPGLKAAVAFLFAIMVAAAGLFGAFRLPERWHLPVGGAVCGIASALFFFADRKRFVRDPNGQIVADRWEIALVFAHFRWTRDKVNRHFFFSGRHWRREDDRHEWAARRPHETQSAARWRGHGQQGRRVVLPGMAREKHGREQYIIRLRPRTAGEPEGEFRHRLNVTGDARLPLTTRARILVDTAAALNPKDEKSFFKTKGAAHIARTLELLADLGRPATPTNAYSLLTSEKALRAALNETAEKEPTERRIRLVEILEHSYLNHDAKEQRAAKSAPRRTTWNTSERPKSSRFSVVISPIRARSPTLIAAKSSASTCPRTTPRSASTSSR